jgi:hypothetical protein
MVAQEITVRFFNAIRVLNRAMPIAAANYGKRGSGLNA